MSTKDLIIFIVAVVYFHSNKKEHLIRQFVGKANKQLTNLLHSNTKTIIRKRNENNIICNNTKSVQYNFLNSKGNFIFPCGFLSNHFIALYEQEFFERHDMEWLNNKLLLNDHTEEIMGFIEWIFKNCEKSNGRRMLNALLLNNRN